MEKNVKLLTELQKMKSLMNYMDGKIVIKEDDVNLRSMLHTLVGNARRLEKRADNYGGVSHHVEEYKKAEQELQNFLKQNPSMMEFLDAVEDHFEKQLYR